MIRLNHPPRRGLSLNGLLLSGVAGLALCAATASAAQEISLDPIIVEQADEQSGAADRATTQYVSQAELERARTGNLKDLFSGIASVAVGGAVPVAQKIFVNGVDMLNLAVTLDGVAQNNRAFHHVSANAIDPGLLKAARADAGAAPADAGPHAIAGSVVFETVDAADILAEDAVFGGDLRLAYGENGKTFTRALTLATRHAGFEALAYAKSATGSDYTTGGNETIAGTAADLQSGLLKLAYEAPEGHRFELSGMVLADDALRRYRANIGEVIGGRPVPELRRYDTERRNLSFSYENTQAEGLWDPKLVIGLSENLINIPDPELSEGRSRSVSGTLQNTFHLSETDTVVAGVDFYDRTGVYDDADEHYREAASNIGVFAQARLEPLAGLKLSFGTRFDWQEFEGEGGFSDSYDGMSNNLSASYALTDELVLRGGYSRVFGGLSIEDNYEYWRSPDWDYAGLKAGESENFTLGADFESGNLRLGGEVFLTKMQDARSYDGNFDFESRGFNLGATYGWEGGFARMTYSNSKVKVNGTLSSSYDAVDFGAPLGQVLALELQQGIGDSGWTLGGSLDLALDYDDVPDTAEEPIKGYEVISVFAEYVPPTRPNLRLRAEVNNLFDVEYADRATYGADFESIVPLMEPGRNVTLSLVSKF